MFLAGSRFLSHWLAGLGIYRSSGSGPGGAADGSPIDMAAFLLLIVASFAVLLGKRFRWIDVAKRNSALVLLYAFGVASLLWSESPLVAFKRLIKSFGTVAMALIIVTEPRPYVTYRQIITPMAIVLLPLSILLIKYYPELGRQYHSTGSQMLTGVTMQKNSLGELCMLIGLYISWNLLHLGRDSSYEGRRLGWPVAICLVGALVWLMGAADSATALVCLAVGVSVHLVAKVGWVKRHPTSLVAIVTATGVALLAAQQAFDAKGMFLALVNRRPDLTTRVPMWEDLLEIAANPLLGFGWQSLSLTAQHQAVVAKWEVVSTHNTYLDLYLNLGLVGLSLYLLLVAAGFWSVTRQLSTAYRPAVLRLSFLIVVLLYGWTETVDLGVGNTYLLLLLGTLGVGDHAEGSQEQNERHTAMRYGSGHPHVAGGKRRPRSRQDALRLHARQENAASVKDGDGRSLVAGGGSVKRSGHLSRRG